MAGRLGKDEDDLLLYARAGVFAVADGVGSTEGACVASTSAMHALARSVVERRRRSLARRARAAVSDARAALAANQQFPGMATTLAFLLVEGDRAVACHLGDSRIYRLRDGHLDQLTEDHTLATELIRAGYAVPPRARSVLSRCLRGRANDEASYLLLQVEPDDRFLLTTDGVTGVVPDVMLERYLGATDPNAAVDAILGHVHRAQGMDDATAVVVDPGRLRSELAPDTQKVRQIPHPTEAA
tara:strand:- start:627 stop:1352 length:726 start_codon:yes stop_codon:yes gene_type:complete